MPVTERSITICHFSITSQPALRRYLLMFADVFRIDVDAKARAGGNSDLTVDDLERRRFAFKLNARSQAFEFMVRHGIGKNRYEMHHVEKSQTAARHVRAAL